MNKYKLSITVWNTNQVHYYCVQGRHTYKQLPFCFLRLPRQGSYVAWPSHTHLICQCSIWSTWWFQSYRILRSKQHNINKEHGWNRLAFLSGKSDQEDLCDYVTGWKGNPDGLEKVVWKLTRLCLLWNTQALSILHFFLCHSLKLFTCLFSVSSIWS